MSDLERKYQLNKFRLHAEQAAFHYRIAIALAEGLEEKESLTEYQKTELALHNDLKRLFN